MARSEGFGFFVLDLSVYIGLTLIKDRWEGLIRQSLRSFLTPSGRSEGFEPPTPWFEAK